MQRKDFLKNMGFASMGLMIPKFPEAIERKPIKIYDNYIRGITHYRFNSLKRIIKAGDELILEREVQNAYDRFAIAVFFQSHKLGYLPAYENIVLANMMDAGANLSAFVSNIDKGRTHYESLAVEVYAHLVIPYESVIQTDLSDKRADDAIDQYRNSF